MARVMVDGPTFVGDDGFVYEVLSVVDPGVGDGYVGDLRRLWEAERRDPTQWWCGCCRQNRGDGAEVPCEHYGFMQPPAATGELPAGMVDLRAVEAGLALAGQGRNIDRLRSDLQALGLPMPIVELLIGREIVKRTNR